MVSTAPSSTKFERAVLSAPTNYMTVGAELKFTASGVSATGNATELPEGTTWAVSDERTAKISEDGILTALSNGSVVVQLLLDGQVVGEKTITIIYPDKLHFTKDKANAVYGEKIPLPIEAYYEGKKVTIKEDDIVFTMEANKDGVMPGTIDGWTFIGEEESGMKQAVITAALASDEEITAKMTISVYKQGELSFDFDKAIGGTRMFAWDRQVSNATTNDNSKYRVVNPDEKMVTSYTFAIDMTQIPIPEQLSELTYMLPGADMEGASAWTFLCQLAERVSPMTTVTPVIDFDDNFDLDISEIKLINDYFVLEGVKVLDEEKNQVEMTLKWIDQTLPIDVTMANPLCMVSGIKLIPRDDAAWDDSNSLPVVNMGSVGYQIFLRASSLVSFAQKEENQKQFGLYPYENPDDPKDAGAFFKDTYTEFEDTYTLINETKEGWILEDEGYVYYVAGARLKGVQEVEGFYYDFGEDGVCVKREKFTGLFEKEDGKTYYSLNGKIATGWNQINGEYHYFDTKTGAAYVGDHKFFNTVTYTFTEEGKLSSGVWYEMSAGTRYYYGPDYHRKGWQLIDGKTYFFKDSYRYEGYQFIVESNDIVAQWYDFGEDGAMREILTWTGLYEIRGDYYYMIDGQSQFGMYKIGDYFYYFLSQSRAAVKDGVYNCTNMRESKLPVGSYKFDSKGRMMVNGEPNEPTEVLKFSGASLTLHDNLTINFRTKALLFEEAGYTNPYVVFNMNGKEIKVTDYTVAGNDYVFAFNNVAPHQMNDTVTATLYGTFKGVEYASAPTDYSVALYAYNMLGKSTDDAYAELRTLLVDLLGYGAASQIYMDHKLDDLVDAKLTDAQKAWGTKEMRELTTVQSTAYEKIDNPTVLWRGAGLNLKDRVEMRFVIEAEDITNLSAKVVSESGAEWTIPAEKFETADIGRYNVYFNGLNAAQLSEPIYVTIYNGDQAVSHTIRYSVESYAYIYQNNEDAKLANIVKAMMIYGDSAYNFSH